jgi:hypothetical protein
VNTQLLDTFEAARMLHSTAGTLRYWRHMGKGPKCFTMGGRKVLYRLEDLEEYLAYEYTHNQRLKPVV